MAQEHPFQHLFETLGRLPSASADSVNRQAFEVLSEKLNVPLDRSGRCILLRAPRAGHGKTHLLSRIRHRLGATHEFIPLQAAFGCRIDASSVTDDTLRRLVRQLPAAGGLCELDLVARRLFAAALQPLVLSGEVPCQDRDGALAALRSKPVETFDFHNPHAVTAAWARENFEVLGQRLAIELAQRTGLPVCDVAFWVDALFAFSSAAPDNPNRIRTLHEHVHRGSGEEMERLVTLLGLLCQLTRVVLVADDLEGFSADDSAALRLAAFLGSLRQCVDRLDVILSLNLDIWQSAFEPRLSQGLSDRLSEVVIELEPLDESEMAALLDSRVPGLGRRVLEEIDLDRSGRHARGLIRAAGLAWLKATAMDSERVPDAEPRDAAPPPIETPIPEIEQEPDYFTPEGFEADVELPAEPPHVVQPSPSSASFDEQARHPNYWNPPEPETPATPAAVEVTPQETAPAEARASIFEPEGWQEPRQPEDPHAAVPMESPAPPAESPFQYADPQDEPAEKTAPETAAEEPPEPAAAAANDPDRVDDLLRQFRQRYGRGSL